MGKISALRVFQETEMSKMNLRECYERFSGLRKPCMTLACAATLLDQNRYGTVRWEEFWSQSSYQRASLTGIKAAVWLFSSYFLYHSPVYCEHQKRRHPWSMSETSLRSSNIFQKSYHADSWTRLLCASTNYRRALLILNHKSTNTKSHVLWSTFGCCSQKKFRQRHVVLGGALRHQTSFRSLHGLH